MNRGQTKSGMLKVAADIILAVSVVPMFASMVLLVACGEVSKGAKKNPTLYEKRSYVLATIIECVEIYGITCQMRRRNVSRWVPKRAS